MNDPLFSSPVEQFVKYYHNQFIDKDESLVMKLYNPEMDKFNGYMFMRLGRSRSEYYSIFFNTRNEIVITDSTKDGIDSIRIIYKLQPSYDFKIDINKIFIKYVDHNPKLFLVINHTEQCIEHELVDKILDKFRSCNLE